MDNDASQSDSRAIIDKKRKRVNQDEFVTEKDEDTFNAKQSEVNSVVKYEPGNVVAPSTGGVTQDSVSHEKNTSLSEKMEVATGGKEDRVDQDVKEKSDSFVPSRSNITKKVKTKKQKRLRELIVQNSMKSKDQKKKVNARNLKDQKDNDVLPHGDIIRDKSHSSGKSGKAKKHKHEKSIEPKTGNVKTEDNKKKINPGVKTKSGSREKRKKAKERKHKSEKDQLTERMLDETEDKGKEVVEKERKAKHKKIEVQTEGKEERFSKDVKEKSNSVVSSKSNNIAKKQKQQSVVQSESQGKEVDAGVKDMKSNDIPSSCGDVTAVSGGPQKIYSITENILHQPDGKDKYFSENVQDKSVSVISPGKIDVTKDFHDADKKGKTKKKKQHSDLTIEPCQKQELNADAKDRKDNEMLEKDLLIDELKRVKACAKEISNVSAYSCSVIEEWGSCKKREKAKKKKHQKFKNTAKTTVNAFENDGKRNYMHPSGCEIIEELGSLEKKREAKHKHKKMKVETESKNVNADVNEEKENDLFPSGCNIIVKSSNRKEKKKAKKYKHKHETRSLTEKMEDEIDRSDNIICQTTADDVTMESASCKERKKSKKRKYGRIIVTKKTEEIVKDLNVGMIGRSGDAIRPVISNVTEESGCYEKRTKSMERGCGSEIVTEKTEERENEINADVYHKARKEITPSNGDCVQETNSCGKKKAKKRKNEICKEKEVIADEKDRTGNGMPLNVTTDKSGGGKERRRWKKRKNEGNLVTEMTGDNGSRVNSELKHNADTNEYLSSGKVANSHGKDKKTRQSDVKTCAMVVCSAQKHIQTNSTHDSESTEEVIEKTTETIDADLLEMKGKKLYEYGWRIS
jgi:hypothetical protein